MSTAFSVLDLAKQGDINAIATLIKNKLESKGIRVKFDCVQGDIKLFLESSQLGGKTVGDAVYKYVEASKFNLQSINYIKIYKTNEGRWKLVYRVEVEQKKTDNVIPLGANSPRAITAPQINGKTSDLLPLKQDLEQLHESVKTEINRLSEISSQLERVLQVLEPKIPSPEPVKTNQEPTELINWLEKLEIKVNSSNQPSASDDVLNQLADIIGNNYQNLSQLHQAIVQSICSRSPFHLNLSNSSQPEISQSTQLCNRLSCLSFLSTYHYNKNTRTISGQVDPQGQIINFFNGIWFERFIYHKITNLFNEYNLSYQCLINPKLEFANGNVFELDFLFWVNQQVLWVECKSGKNYNPTISTYENHRNSLELPKESSMMVLLQADTQQTGDLTTLRGLTIVNPDNCIDQIKQTLNLDS
ncbi:hypothetical protein AB3M80_02600 [Arthrospira platensis BEA 1257B]